MSRYIWIFVLLCILVPITTAAPNFITPENEHQFNITEKNNFQYMINASDPEDYYPINFTDTSHDPDVGFYCFNKEKNGPSSSFINFTPTNEYVGEYSFHIIATNSEGDSKTIKVHFNVSNTNDPPNIISTSPSDPVVAENSSISLYANASDIDIPYGDNLTFTWLLDNKTSPKLNYSKTSMNSSNATYSPRVEDFDAGLHNITVIVEDNHGAKDNFTWEVQVTNVNRPPVFNKTIPDENKSITWKEDHNLTDHLNLSKYFYDPDTNGTLTEVDTGFSLEFSYNFVESNFSNITININETTSEVTFIPAKDFWGTANVTFSVYDNYEYAYSNNVTLNVTNVNDAPRIESISNMTTYENKYYSHMVNASDVDNDNLTYYVSSPTLSGISINQSGLIELYTETGDSGNHTINVTVGDGKLNSSELFNLEIKPNDRPQIIPFSNQSVQQYEDFTLVVNGTDDDNDNLTFSTNVSFLNPGERLNRTAWNFSFTPREQEMVGNHSITINVNDTHDSKNTFNFTLEIIDKHMPPNLSSVSVPNNQIKVNHPFNYTVTAFDEEGNVHLFSDNSSLFDITTVSNGSMDENAIGNISFTPSSTGYHEINISVNDTTGLYDWTIFNLNITTNHEPYFTSVNNITTEEQELYQQQVSAEDFDWQDNLTFGDNASASTDFYINPDSGLINFTPPSQEFYIVELWVSDGTANTTVNISVNITEINDPPYFTHNVSNMSEWDNVVEASESVINITAADEEHNRTGTILNMSADIINFTNLNDTVFTNKSLFQFENVRLNTDNTTTGTLNFTPDSEDVGTYWANISVTDNNSVTSAVFSFDVRNLNNPPQINWSMEYPNGTGYGPFTNITYKELNCTENKTVNIKTSVFDPDYDNLNYTWYNVDNSAIVGNKSNISYTIPFDAYPNTTLKLSVDDGTITKNITWLLNATNVNRHITFGAKEINFSIDGSFNNTKLEEGNLILEKQNSTHYMQGNYTSPVLDFKSTSVDLPRIGYSKLLINDENNNTNTTDKYNITYYTATNNDEPYTPNWKRTDNRTIISDDLRYLQYKAKITFSNESVANITPALNPSHIKYYIKDQQAPESTEYSAWLDLNNFFHDPDTDDEINYNYEILGGSGTINLTFQQDHYVGLKFIEPGDVQVRFNASDNWNSSAHSNVIDITVESSDSGSSETTTTTSSGTDTETEIQTQVEYKYKEQEEPVAFDIIHPERVAIYKNETVEIPLTLKNKDDFTLRDMKIDAFTERGGLDISLDKTHLDMLAKNSQTTVMLEAKMKEMYESYDLQVVVNSSEPDFDDSAKILISSLKKAKEDNTSQQMKLAFVSDLLKRNEECAELTEYVERARDYLKNGQTAKAEETLDRFINDCKVLINQKEPKQEKPNLVTGFMTNALRDTEYLVISITLAVLFFATLIGGLIMGYRKIHS